MPKKYTDEFVIDRGEWLPREAQDHLKVESVLYHKEHGRMCCLWPKGKPKG